ncbi:SufD family Fe-S cluster assembly protein [Desulfobaculum bizertense]|uniref:SufB/SufD family protein n=1 Tax=Desulfobaculum bizertense TaxID=376490 RepID=UPI001F273B71|nr:SufD family Fe-S cluster assembly protein [Desulfobaculum bizertense]UIJ38140.1 SufD family Fe-S cluster assembly protein [Desulfobaculum bizertense]
MKDVNLSEYSFEGGENGSLVDLRNLDEADKKRLVMAGVDVNDDERAGSYLHMNHGSIHCTSHQEGLELMDIKDALKKFDGLPDYFWKLIDPEKDEFTREAFKNLHGGYFVRVKKGVKIAQPVQSCLFMKGHGVGQNVHNLVIVEDDAELHLITGCAVSSATEAAAHLGISEFYIGKNAKLTFTMIHNWGEEVVVRPRTHGVVEDGGEFQNNYVLMSPVGNLQSAPVIDLNGRGARARLNSVLVAPKGSYLSSGGVLNLNAPDTRGEIISRTLTTGGTIVAPGRICAKDVPARGHLECKGLILGDGRIHAIPELDGYLEGVELSHEAAVGKIAQEEIEYLQARGLDEDEATSTIVRGFLNVEMEGLPEELQRAIKEQIDQLDSSEDVL